MSNVNDENDLSCYDYYRDSPDFESEASFEARRLAAVKAEHAITLLRWQPIDTKNPRVQIDVYAVEITARLQAAEYTLLVDSFNELSDPFPYFVPAIAAYHRTLVFQVPNNKALCFILKLSSHTYPDGSGGVPNLSVGTVGEVARELDDTTDAVCGTFAVLPGFHSCGGSRGYVNENRWDFGAHYEENIYGAGLPSTDAVLNALTAAQDALEQAVVLDSPFQGRPYMGNNVDNSYVFADGHRQTRSHELFWERAGDGKAKLLKIMPKAMFTTYRGA